MPTIQRTLADRKRGWRAALHDVTWPGFVHGGCYEFAIALHEGLAWPLVGLVDGDKIPHVGVRSPEGRLFDARGYVSKRNFAAPFGQSADLIREVSLAELTANYQPNQRGISRVRQIAETLWPDLPWLGETFAGRVEAFTDELEMLCRKHGLWITGSVPADPPLIEQGDGTEGGYIITPTAEAAHFTLERYFAEG